MSPLNITRTATTTPSQNTLPHRSLVPSLVALISLALTLSVGTAAYAQVSLQIQPSPQSGNPGSLLSYNGTVTNLGTAEVFLNSGVYSLAGTGLTLNESPFFNNFPLSLTSGQTFTGILFTVQIGTSAAPGLYNGTFTIQGGLTDTTFDNLVTQNFSVGVNGAAPEPATVSLLLLGGATLATVARRRKSNRRP